jgi:uncharacterized protein YjbI with pentapeptide repeats
MASLGGAMLNDTDCRGADFRGANLKGSYFRNADLEGAVFTEEEITKFRIELSRATNLNKVVVRGLLDDS